MKFESKIYHISLLLKDKVYQKFILYLAFYYMKKANKIIYVY